MGELSQIDRKKSPMVLSHLQTHPTRQETAQKEKEKRKGHPSALPVYSPLKEPQYYDSFLKGLYEIFINSLNNS